VASRKSKKPLSELHALRIALIKPSALGDIVHALPVLSGLRQRFPSAHITWIVKQHYAPLLEGHPDLDAVLTFDRKIMGNVWRAGRSWWNFAQRLQAARFDLVIDLQGLFRSGLMCWWTGAKRQVGLATAQEGSCWFYTDIVDSRDMRKLHAVERYWQVVRALGGSEQELRFRVPLRDDAVYWAKELLADYPRPWLCFGVGASRPTKRWLPAHFAALAEKARLAVGGTIIFVGRAEETPLAQAVAHSLTGLKLDLTGGTTLPQLAAILSLADVMVANDTGPLHLAAALGRPVIAPYTCTKIELHGPYGPHCRAVASSVPCQGSYLHQCSRMDCMRELTPERVWPALHEVLEEWLHTYQFV
jgi:lipopolysaccharide heptosyltransferase I